MTQHSRRARRTRPTLRLWTYDQLQVATPYVSSILRSLREVAVLMQSLRRRRDTLANHPGRPTRKLLIDLEDTTRDLLRCEDQYREVSEELEALGLSPCDSVKGLALAPFMHDDQLAWFIFDLHDDPRVRFWRYQADAEDTRRKLTYAQM